jgi:hypothetical protein
MYTTANGGVQHLLKPPAKPKFRWQAWAPKAMKRHRGVIVLTRKDADGVDIQFGFDLRGKVSPGGAVVQVFTVGNPRQGLIPGGITHQWDKDSTSCGTYTSFDLAAGNAVRLELTIDGRKYLSKPIKP